MPFVTCSFCGRGSMQSLNIEVCMNCLELNDPKIQIFAIKRYLQKNPNAKYAEISKVLKISKKRMDEFIEEGSLEIIYKDGEEVISTETNKGNKKEKTTEEKRRKMLSELTANIQSGNNGNISNSKLVEDLQRRKNKSGEER